eukprot:Opistho-1_new@27931
MDQLATNHEQTYILPIQKSKRCMSMDDTDRQLIALLRDDARLPVVTIASKLRVARATVQNRLARLEREGTIVGYTVRLRPDAEAHRIRAIMSIGIPCTLR